METQYNRELKRAGRRLLAGKVIVVASLSSAALWAANHKEKPAAKVGLDGAAIAVAIVGGLEGHARSYQRRYQAGIIAVNAQNIAAREGLEVPAWTHRGARELEKTRQKIAEMTGRDQ